MDIPEWLCLPATPLQYLQRLALVNRWFADDVRFVGLDVGPQPYTNRIRTTQPHVPGEAPSPTALAGALRRDGFRQVFRHRSIGAYNAMTFRKGTLWLFDVRPSNFKWCDGVIFPIDVIAQRWHGRIPAGP